jgi:Domain of unknown function (DUF4157)
MLTTRLKSSYISAKPVTIPATNRRSAAPSRTAGLRAMATAQPFGPVQAKLTVGPANDRFEQEADRVADDVMRMPEPGAANETRPTNGSPPPAISPLPGVSPVRRMCAECEDELHRKPAAAPIRRQVEDEEQVQTKQASDAAPHLAASTASLIAGLGGGSPLPASERAFFERRFGRDLSGVRIHDGTAADAAARSIQARAFTLGSDIAFAGGEYGPGAAEGRRLMAHELAHTVQQEPSGAPEIRRSCTSAATCAAPIAGDPEEFSTSEEAVEAGPRARRRRMTPTRARRSGHAGRAAQLEKILNDHSPARLALLHGIFIDADVSSGTAAYVTDCADWLADSLPAADPDPAGMATATKPCMFVPGRLNREALQFNHGDPTIGGESRDAWRAEALNTLIHETEHVSFEIVEPALPVPPGVTSPDCTKANVAFSLGEIVSILSEFPLHFDAAQAEADPTGPAHARLTAFLHGAVTNPGENLPGALLDMGCHCDCNEVDLFVIQAVDTMTTTLSADQRNGMRTALQGQLPGPARPFWPPAPPP